LNFKLLFEPPEAPSSAVHLQQAAGTRQQARANVYAQQKTHARQVMLYNDFEKIAGSTTAAGSRVHATAGTKAAGGAQSGIHCWPVDSMYSGNCCDGSINPRMLQHVSRSAAQQKPGTAVSG
jgi:hypothetical protein